MSWEVERTDTFGGEANYCWVRRETIPSRDGESQASVMRRAKAAVGATGQRGRTFPFGGIEGWEFRPYGRCEVVFVTWTDEESES